MLIIRKSLSLYWAFVIAPILIISGNATTEDVIHKTINMSAAGPVLFFTDLESGPNSGGQDDLGVFITLYGEGFGSSRGNSTVTIGGHEVGRYVIWGQDNAVARDLDMIVIQPGPDAISGSMVVTVDGRASNPLPFTVRNGEIYFVIPGDPNANDSKTGTYTAPFKTLYRPRQSLKAGDIVYIKGGTFSTADPLYPGWDAVLMVYPDTDANGSAERPIAYVGYPGDPPVLGGPQPMRRGIYVDQLMTYYIFANLKFTHYSGNMELSGNGHRIVGNSSYDGIFCNGGAIGILGNCAHYNIYGNHIRNNGEIGDKVNGPGFYLQGFGTNQDIDFGWNQIMDQHGSRAIQLFGHADGDHIDDIRIHDNLISGSELDNIVLGGSDGNNDVLGTVYVYNNIFTCSGTPGLRINDPQGTIYILNNVLYNNGSQAIYEDEHAQIYFQRAGAGLITIQNNIFFAEAGETYFWIEPGVDPSVLIASNNLWFNAGAAPGWDINNVGSDPLFMDLASGDFRLRDKSPAINAGINTGISQDYFGVPRDENFDIGACEYSLSTAVEKSGYQASLLYNFFLVQNFPNPFNSRTTISYSIPTRSDIRIDVYNTLGEFICNLVNENKPAGNHSIDWNARDYQGKLVASNIYFCQMTTSTKIMIKKMLLLK